MTKTRDQQADQFSLEIFSQKWNSLDIDQRFFVMAHLHEYEKYRREIASLARKAMTKQMRGDQYDQILTWYFQRIPLGDVLAGMLKCIDIAVANCNAIYSLKYFNAQVQTQFKNSMKHGDPSRKWKEYETSEGPYAGYDKYMCRAWKEYRGKPGWQFNFFYGPYQG